VLQRTLSRLERPWVSSRARHEQPQNSDIAEHPKSKPLRDSRKVVNIRSMTPTTPPPTANRLLAELPNVQYQRLELFALPLGLAIHQAGTRLTHE